MINLKQRLTDWLTDYWPSCSRCWRPCSWEWPPHCSPLRSPSGARGRSRGRWAGPGGRGRRPGPVCPCCRLRLQAEISSHLPLLEFRVLVEWKENWTFEKCQSFSIFLFLPPDQVRCSVRRKERNNLRTVQLISAPTTSSGNCHWCNDNLLLIKLQGSREHCLIACLNAHCHGGVSAPLRSCQYWT